MRLPAHSTRRANVRATPHVANRAARLAPLTLIASLASCHNMAAGGGHADARAWFGDVAPALSISPLSYTPYAGSSVPLEVVGAGGAGGTGGAGETAVMWSTQPYQRAWVTSDGVAHFYEPGRVRVIARRDGLTATTDLEIRENPVAELTARRDYEGPVFPGDSLRITATAHDAEGEEVLDVRPTFAIDARGVQTSGASISDDGLFIAGRPGIVTILVEANGHAASIPVLVRPSPALVVEPALPTSADTPDSAATRAHRLAPVVVTPAATRRVRIESADFFAFTGTSVQLEAQVWMHGASRADSSAVVTWTSSDPSIAMIDADGFVSFRRKGWVKLTASHGGVSHTRRLLVRRNPVAHMVLQSNARYPRVGQPVKLRDEAWMRGGTPVPHARTYLGVVSERDHAPRATISEDREFIASEPGVYTVLAVLGGRASKTTFVVYPNDRRCELGLRRWDPSCRD